jgi:hypothetical protein
MGNSTQFCGLRGRKAILQQTMRVWLYLRMLHAGRFI